MNGLLSSNGGTSSTRVVMFVVVGALLFQHVWVTVKTGTIAPWSMEEVFVLASVLGLKGWQKITERASGDVK